MSAICVLIHDNSALYTLGFTQICNISYISYKVPTLYLNTKTV